MWFLHLFLRWNNFLHILLRLIFFCSSRMCHQNLVLASTLFMIKNSIFHLIDENFKCREYLWSKFTASFCFLNSLFTLILHLFAACMTGKSWALYLFNLCPYLIIFMANNLSFGFEKRLGLRFVLFGNLDSFL